MSRRTELDRIHEFIEGLRPEFIIPVQSAMPASVADAVEKARAVETAFSIGMDLSAYSILPEYIMEHLYLPRQIWHYINQHILHHS